MLILSRKLNESIVIDGRIVVRIMRVDGDIVKVGIEAPKDVPVHRQEVYDEIQRSNQEAMNSSPEALPHLARVLRATPPAPGASPNPSHPPL